MIAAPPRLRNILILIVTLEIIAIGAAVVLAVVA